MDDLILASLLVAAAFAAVHVVGGRLTFLAAAPRSVWLSAAGGVSVAYVFVHLLPELAEHQRVIDRSVADGWLARVETHGYLAALLGLATFYGLDRLARSSALAEHRAGRARQPTAGVFWIHLGAFALYNLLIGYLLLHREEGGGRGLAVYAVAMALHFVVNDHGLREQHGRGYDARGRWLLAAAPLLGWVLGLAATIDAALLAACFSFLAGGVVLNVLKEELPEDRESRFAAFALGAAAYAALLLMA